MTGSPAGLADAGGFSGVDPGRTGAARGRRFEAAGPEDDAAIRRLLRETPLGSGVRLALTREPDYFAAAEAVGVRHAAVVMRDEDGGILALGARSVREVWWDGRPALLGYLEQLRFAPGRRPGRRTLAEGYARILELRRPDELPFHLTSILADNHPARRLLERGLPGLPTYVPVARLVTLVLRVPRARGPGTPEPGQTPDGRPAPETVEALAGLLERDARRVRLAPRWSRRALAVLAAGGLGPWRPLVVRRGAHATGCAAVWDPSLWRQCVVSGYAPALSRLRPWVNPGLRLLGRPALPPPGTRLRLGYLSHLAAEDAESACAVVGEARRTAAGLGLQLLALGLPVGSSWLAALRRRFRGRAYASVLYLVTAPGDRPSLPSLRPEEVAVEVATL